MAWQELSKVQKDSDSPLYEVSYSFKYIQSFLSDGEFQYLVHDY